MEDFTPHPLVASLTSSNFSIGPEPAILTLHADLFKILTVLSYFKRASGGGLQYCASKAGFRDTAKHLGRVPFVSIICLLLLLKVCIQLSDVVKTAQEMCF